MKRTGIVAPSSLRTGAGGEAAGSEGVGAWPQIFQKTENIAVARRTIADKSRFLSCDIFMPRKKRAEVRANLGAGETRVDSSRGQTCTMTRADEGSLKLGNET